MTDNERRAHDLAMFLLREDVTAMLVEPQSVRGIEDCVDKYLYFYYRTLGQLTREDMT